MHKSPLAVRKSRIFIASATLVLLFLLYPNFAHAAGFKSEDELIDETRKAVTDHLKKEGSIRSTQPAQIKTDSVWEKSSKDTLKAETADTEPVQKAKSTEKPNPVIKSAPAKSAEPVKTADDAQKSVPAQEDLSDENQDSTPPEIIDGQIVPSTSDEAEGIDEELGKGTYEVKAMEEPILKKMDVSRIGASNYYATYEGFRFLKYFTVGQRVEIYQQPRPIDSYILDAHSIPQIYANRPWNIESDYRTQLTPVFTRAYGTEFTISDPKDKSGQIRYTHDYRELYKNYFPKWPHIKKEMWDQNDILIMHSRKIEPLGWNYTSNIGYRYSTITGKMINPDVANDKSFDEVRHTYYASLALAPDPTLEWFGQAEYFKSMHIRSYYDYRPDHFMGRLEMRVKSKDMTTSFVPQFSYSKDYYYPFADTYEKYEIAYRVGRDFTKRFSATSTLQLTLSLRDTPDNTGPLYDGIKRAFKDKAYVTSWQNRFSYNLYDRLYLQWGADIENGLNWSIFDNLGILGGIEYYAPGMIRVDVGWQGNYYYNLCDFMSSVYFKFYLFM